MERRTERKDSKGSESDFDVVEAIKKLCHYNARAELHTEEQLTLFLQSWWSRTYNRPLKDPLLETYTLEELLYEFYDRIERTKAQQEMLEQVDVKIEEDKDRANEDWAEKMEREELEAEMRKSNGETKSVDPTKDPANIAWMEKQIEDAKAVYGETFGEDIDENFDG